MKITLLAREGADSSQPQPRSKQKNEDNLVVLYLKRVKLNLGRAWQSINIPTFLQKSVLCIRTVFTVWISKFNLIAGAFQKALSNYASKEPLALPLYFIGLFVVSGNLFVGSLYEVPSPSIMIPREQIELGQRIAVNLEGSILSRADAEVIFETESASSFAAPPSLVTEKSVFEEEPASGQINREGRSQTAVRPSTYTVRKGDSLSVLAQSFGLRTATLKYANNLSTIDSIKEGQVLKIPKEDYSDRKLAQLSAEEQKKTAKAKKSGAKVILASNGGGNVAADDKWLLPVSYSYVSRGIGRGHTGIDYVAPRGTRVISSCSGVVSAVGPWGSYSGGRGNYVTVNCGGGITMNYYHLSAYSDAAVPGKSVAAGTLLGAVGSTGNSTGDHLHFEPRRGGTPFDPGLR